MSLLPGLLLSLTVAAAAILVHAGLGPRWGAGLSEVLLAVALGLAWGARLPRRALFAPGIRVAYHHFLRAAIVLLGLRFSLEQVLSIGGRALVLVVLLMSLALAMAHGLGRWLGVPPRLASLIGVGTSVCGNSAISATAPVIGARDEELSYAIGVNTLFGTLAVFAYPWLGEWMHLGAGPFGTWVGTAVNDTSQVLATGFAHGQRAGEVATAVKLTRNALMGLVIVGMAWAHGRRGARMDAGRSRWRASFPGFVLGFLALATLRQFGGVDALSRALSFDLADAGGVVAKRLVIVALAGVGLGTHLPSLRAIGWRPLAVGFATAATTSVVSLLWIHWIGAVG